MKVVYTATAKAAGGREGHVRSSDGYIDFDLSIPETLGGKGGTGSNPEQMFASGYAACFEGAFRYVAQLNKKPVTDASVTAIVGIGFDEVAGFKLAVELQVSASGIDRADAETFAQEAHMNICPYSKATRGNIDVKIVVV